MRFLDIHRDLPGSLTEAHLRDQVKSERSIWKKEKVDIQGVYFSPSKGEAICFTEAPSAEAVITAHKKTGMTCDEVLPVVFLKP